MFPATADGDENRAGNTIDYQAAVWRPQAFQAGRKYLLRKLSELLKPFLLSAARLRYRR
jgi:hypothetical protein